MSRNAALAALLFVHFLVACSGRPGASGPTEIGFPAAEVPATAQRSARATPPETPDNTAATAVPTARPTGTPSNETTIPDNLFTLPAAPIAVAPEADESRAVTAVVPLEGATLTAAAGDGSRFTLEIPATALLEPTEITLKPLTTLGRLPLSGGLGAGVQLEPDGLRLLDFATLTIVPAQPIPAAEQILFGYLGSGDDFHLESPGPDRAVIQLQLLHFSGYGVGQGTGADRTAVAQSLPDNAEARFHNQLGLVLQDSQQPGTPGAEAAARLIALFENYERDVMQPALARAGAGCAEGKAALSQFLAYERLRQLLGVGDVGGELARLATVLNTVGLKCVQEAYEACVEAHDLAPLIPTVLSFERMRQLLGMSDETDDPLFDQMMRLIRNCFTFELEFDSATGTAVEGSGFDSAVRARVTITLGSIIPFRMSGSGVLDAMYYIVNFEGCTQGATTSQGDEFEVLALNFTLTENGDTSEVTGLEMLYQPGQTLESATLNCEGISIDVPQTPGPVWTGLYTALHLDNLAASSSGAVPPNLDDLAGGGVGDDDLAEHFPGVPALPMAGMTGIAQAGDGGFVLKDWELLKGELYATREYDREQEFLYEVTSFNLYHRPPR